MFSKLTYQKKKKVLNTVNVQPAILEERKACGTRIENLALSAETPCFLYAKYLPSGSTMRFALGGCRYTFFGNGVEEVSCLVHRFKAAD